MLARLADGSRRLRWLVLILWLVVFVSGLLFGRQVFTNLGEGPGYDPSQESSQVLERLTELGAGGQQVIALVDGIDTDDPELAEEVRAAAAAAAEVDGVEQVLHPFLTPTELAALAAESSGTPSDVAPGSTDQAAGTAPPDAGQDGGPLADLVARDGRAVIVQVNLDPSLQEGAKDTVTTAEEVREALRGIDAPEVLVGGSVFGQQAFAEQAERDLARGEATAIPIMLVLLVLLIGGFLAASVPLAVAATAISGGLLVLLAVTELVWVNQFAVNVVIMFGLGLSVDYSLLMVSRFREERGAGADIPEALRRMLTTAGRTVIYSGITVAVALSGLLLFREPWLNSMAYAAVGVVIVGGLAALTLVPALLAVVGRRVKPSTPAGDHGLFYRIARVVQRRALIFVPVLLLGLAAAAWPFTHAELRNGGVDVLPAGSEARQIVETIDDRFPGGGPGPVVVLVEAAATDPGVLDVAERAEALPGAQQVTVEALDSNVSAVQVTPGGDTQGPEARALVEELRALDTPVETLVGGEAAILVDYRDSISERLPWAFGLIVLATLVLLFLMTGSVVVPIKAIIMGVISLGAAFGVLVWVFQDGGLSWIPGFEPTGYIEITIPVLVFVFGFGLSMDYEIFLLARIKEVYDDIGDNDRAVALGIQRTGRVVTAAAVLITVVFLGFAAGDLAPIKQAGVGLAVAVILDATIVRMLLVPATMQLLGDWNWWAPRPLRRFHARFGLHEAPSTLSTPAPAKPTPEPAPEPAPVPVSPTPEETNITEDTNTTTSDSGKQ